MPENFQKGPSDHPFFARFYHYASRKFDKKLLGEKRSTLLQKVQGKTLEIGVGTGVNFPYYPPEIELTAIDPDFHMMKYSQKRDPFHHVHLIQASAEELPFADASFDSVVSTLVLCTVPSPSLALKELWRVLKPKGRFYFLEHVRSSSPFSGQVQHLMTPLWKCVAGGCHLDRQTEQAILQTGFRYEEFSRDENFLKKFLPLIWGVAKKEISTSE